MRKIFLLFILSLACSCVFAQVNERNGEEIVMVDKMPAYPGGEEAMDEFIKERLFYPWEGDTIKGRVSIYFTVDKFGDLCDLKVLRGVHPLADSIAVNIVRDMPRWIPATQIGIPVPVNFTLAINFDPAEIEADKKLNATSSVKPSFRGGDGAIYRFIFRNFEYPDIYPQLQGTVTVQFIIDSNGKIWYPYIQQSLDPDYDTEVLRIVRMMPNWLVPDGNVGCYLHTMPVKFRIEE